MRDAAQGAPRRVIAATGTTPGLPKRGDAHPAFADHLQNCRARPEALRSSEVVLSSPSSLLRPQPPVSMPSRRLPVSRLYVGSSPYGRVLADMETFPALSHRSFPRCRPPIRRGALRVHASDCFPADTGLRPSTTGSALPNPLLALSAPQTRELLVVHADDAAAFASCCGPKGCSHPWPTDLAPEEPGRRVLVLPGFHAQGSPPGAPDMTTWAHRTTPRAGLPPAGSMLLRAAHHRGHGNDDPCPA